MDRFSRGKESRQALAAAVMIVLLNQRAGPVDRECRGLAEDVARAFAAAGIAAEVHVTDPAALGPAVQQHATRQPEAIVVGGGDGTISTAAGLLIETGIPLGLLPLGTLNHFAKDVGLPNDWQECVVACARRVVRRVDVGEVNGRIFLNTCSLGGYAAALRRREWLRRRAGHGKWRAMFWGTFATLRHVRRLHLVLETPAERRQLRASFVLVANNRYQDDALVSGRRVQMDEGNLWVYSSPAQRWRDLFRLALELWRHGIGAATQLDARRTPQLVLSGLPPPWVHAAIDGEIVPLHQPLHFRIRPQALSVYAPAPAS